MQDNNRRSYKGKKESNLPFWLLAIAVIGTVIGMLAGR